MDFHTGPYEPSGKAHDLSDINALNAAAFAQPPMTAQEFDEFLGQGRMHFFVARESGTGRIVATLTLHTYLLSCGGKNRNVGWIEQVATHPDYEGRGLGTKLLKLGEAEVRASLIGRPRLTSSKKGAQKFYRKRGWRETSSRVFELTLPTPAQE